MLKQGFFPNLPSLAFGRHVLMHVSAVINLFKFPLHPPYRNCSHFFFLALKYHLWIFSLHGPESCFKAHFAESRANKHTFCVSLLCWKSQTQTFLSEPTLAFLQDIILQVQQCSSIMSCRLACGWLGIRLFNCHNIWQETIQFNQ